MAGEQAGGARLDIAARTGRRRRDRREELVAAATDYVLENGLVGLSLRPLAAAVGVSHRTLLYHFGSKEELFREVLRECRARERAAILGAPGAGPETLADALRTAWQRRAVQMEGPWFRFYMHLQALVVADPEQHGRLTEEMRSDWLESISIFLHREGVDPERVEAMATLVYATFCGLQIDAWTSRDSARATAGFEELIRMVAQVRAHERGESP